MRILFQFMQVICPMKKDAMPRKIVKVKVKKNNHVENWNQILS